MKNAKYMIRRLLVMIPILLGMSFLVFVLMRVVPGDPVGALLGFQATPEAMAHLRKELGLDRPVLDQYVSWLGEALQGNLGVDYRARMPITEIIAQRVPVTLELTILAMLFALVISLPLGILAATRPNTTPDHFAVSVSLFGITMPDFWIGMLLIFLVALRLDLLPASGFVPLSRDPVANFSHLLLPATTLAITSAAVQIRMIRSAMLEVLSQNYIKVARAKGLPEQIVLVKHALRNAAMTIVTVVGMQFGYSLGGAIVVEQLFGLPGIGKLVADAVFTRNYPVIQATVILIAFMFMLVNLTTDVAYAYINPQVE